MGQKILMLCEYVGVVGGGSMGMKKCSRNPTPTTLSTSPRSRSTTPLPPPPPHLLSHPRLLRHPQDRRRRRSLRRVRPRRPLGRRPLPPPRGRRRRPPPRLPTSVLFGADWGPLPHSPSPNPTPGSPARPSEPNQSQDDFDAFTIAKATELAKPLKEAGIPYKIHIVKDHDMKERLCLEVERLGLSAIIMGSRGFGAAMRGSDGRLGSVSDYCVHHCVCPVVVVRYPDDKDIAGGNHPVVAINERKEDEEDVDEEEHQKGLIFC
ncbi:hypothetical protein MLD38_040285 [Melastoma candidum]|uniref:Uncharacterized protein n=1 Tax=Melastoma candidum TaxID=119954 RepID=A0ACB9L5P7_9MYRT|nr:hypothetical protein MLD38_040285 [Melastoma candidum]